jgi:triacylglycerol lipase
MKNIIFNICFTVGSLLLTGCASYAHTFTGGNPENVIAPTGEISLKYPIVLVHGIAKHDRGRHVVSWGRIPEVLKRNGMTVFFGNTDAWGSIETNAEILKVTIDRILTETEYDKVNIIAHSKGGIVSRYLIWRYDYGDKVASLTTISTPHHGSEIADYLFNMEIVHTRGAMRWYRVIGILFGDKNPDIHHVIYQLTTANMKIFNDIVSMDERVYCQSIYSVMNGPSGDSRLSRSYRFLRSKSGENDGIISEYSARWGDNIKKIEGGISHEQIIDHIHLLIGGINVLPIYLDIARELSRKGF